MARPRQHGPARPDEPTQPTLEHALKLLIGRQDLEQAAVRAIAKAAPDTTVETLDIRPANRAARPFLDGGIALCEIPLVTLIQSIAFGKSVGLLPVTTLGRYQHHTLVTRKELGVDDLAGHRVGVRSWSQTTGVWLRGILADEYGVDLRAVTWQTYEPGHVREYTDPSWVTRADPDATLAQDFLNGAVDFAILGHELPQGESGIGTAIPEAHDAGRAWSARTGFAPVNHVIGVDLASAPAHTDAACATYDALAKILAAQNSGPVVTEPFGFSALRRPFEQAATYAYHQQLLPDPVIFDDVVARTCEALGVPPARLDE